MSENKTALPCKACFKSKNSFIGWREFFYISPLISNASAYPTI